MSWTHQHWTRKHLRWHLSFWTGTLCRMATKMVAQSSTLTNWSGMQVRMQTAGKVCRARMEHFRLPQLRRSVDWHQAAFISSGLLLTTCTDGPLITLQSSLSKQLKSLTHLQLPPLHSPTSMSGLHGLLQRAISSQSPSTRYWSKTRTKMGHSSLTMPTVTAKMD